MLGAVLFLSSCGDGDLDALLAEIEADTTTTQASTLESDGECRNFDTTAALYTLDEMVPGATTAVVLETGISSPRLPERTIWVLGFLLGDHVLLHESAAPPEENAGPWASLDARTEAVALFPFGPEWVPEILLGNPNKVREAVLACAICLSKSERVGCGAGLVQAPDFSEPGSA